MLKIINCQYITTKTKSITLIAIVYFLFSFKSNLTFLRKKNKIKMHNTYKD